MLRSGESEVSMSLAMSQTEDSDIGACKILVFFLFIFIISHTTIFLHILTIFIFILCLQYLSLSAGVVEMQNLQQPGMQRVPDAPELTTDLKEMLRSILKYVESRGRKGA